MNGTEEIEFDCNPRNSRFHPGVYWRPLLEAGDSAEKTVDCPGMKWDAHRRYAGAGIGTHGLAGTYVDLRVPFPDGV